MALFSDKAIFFINMCKFFLIVIALLNCSCSLVNRLLSNENEGNLPKEYLEVTDQDYINHLVSLIPSLLHSQDVKPIKLTTDETAYFKRISQKIFENNEKLLKEHHTPNIYIINAKDPFFFSLPKGHYFFSLALFKKYFSNENLLISCLTYEVIKSLRGVYLKKMVIPTGFISIEKILYLTRLPPSIKMTLNKWTYLAMKRSGFDPSAYLYWIQTQNKNSLDFSFQTQDPRSITAEEFKFKNFMFSEGQSASDQAIIFGNSSKDFYKLISRLKNIDYNQ